MTYSTQSKESIPARRIETEKILHDLSDIHPSLRLVGYIIEFILIRYTLDYWEAQDWHNGIHRPVSIEVLYAIGFLSQGHFDISQSIFSRPFWISPMRSLILVR
jgi:hypothetical protein